MQERSFCAWARQVCYRILPTFQQAESKAPKVIFDDDMVNTILYRSRFGKEEA